MSDMTHSDAEEALVNGDAEDVEEALASERAEAEAPPEEAAMSLTPEEVTARSDGRRIGGSGRGHGGRAGRDR